MCVCACASKNVVPTWVWVHVCVCTHLYCLYVCACMSLCARVMCVRVGLKECACMNTWAVHVYMFMCRFVHIFVCVCMCPCLCTCVFVCMYTDLQLRAENSPWSVSCVKLLLSPYFFVLRFWKSNPGPLHMLGKCSITEQHPQPTHSLESSTCRPQH
jgi:hypothetical protein